MDISEHFKEERVQRGELFFAETCIIANNADDPADEDLFVTLPNSEEPRKRERVHYWQPGINLDGTVRLPEAQDRGMVIHMDTGELWLIF